MSDAIEALRRRYPDAVTFRFGDNPALCDELLSLVRAGRKLATFNALRDIQNGESMPCPAAGYRAGLGRRAGPSHRNPGGGALPLLRGH